MYSFSYAAKTIGFSIDRLYEKEIEDNEWPYGALGSGFARSLV
jgi:hypothetical protein